MEMEIDEGNDQLVATKENGRWKEKRRKWTAKTMERGSRDEMKMRKTVEMKKDEENDQLLET